MISIIIPVFNEANEISTTIEHVKSACVTDQIEIILVDGGSSDETVSVAEKAGVIVVKSKKGRARQMNFGVSIANGEILYFLHADSKPPCQFDRSILNAYQTGARSGCFRLAFDYDHWFLKANSWFTRFDVNAIRFGDQSLFVTKEVFYKSGGFDANLLIMEDQEIIYRLKKYGKFIVMKGEISTSARKYLDNGIYKMQGIFFRIWALYYLGCSQEHLLNVYRNLIRKHKL
ncbi:rSAM/selenodomain-associated transferase 2 [Pedobacter sp. UYEF25]